MRAPVSPRPTPFRPGCPLHPGSSRSWNHCDRTSSRVSAVSFQSPFVLPLSSSRQPQILVGRLSRLLYETRVAKPSVLRHRYRKGRERCDYVQDLSAPHECRHQEADKPACRLAIQTRRSRCPCRFAYGLLHRADLSAIPAQARHLFRSGRRLPVCVCLLYSRAKGHRIPSGLNNAYVPHKVHHREANVKESRASTKALSGGRLWLNHAWASNTSTCSRACAVVHFGWCREPVSNATQHGDRLQDRRVRAPNAASRHRPR